MTHHPQKSKLIDVLMQLLGESGLDHLAEAVARLLHEAMKLERSKALAAAPDRRRPERQGALMALSPRPCRLGWVPSL